MATAGSDERESSSALRAVIEHQARMIRLRDAEIASLHAAYGRLLRTWPHRLGKALTIQRPRLGRWLTALFLVLLFGVLATRV